MPYSSHAFLTLEDAQVGYASLSAVKLIRLNGYQASEGRDLRLRLPSFLAIVYRMTARGGRDGDFG
jgi:hypothetical protein